MIQIEQTKLAISTEVKITDDYPELHVDLQCMLGQAVLDTAIWEAMTESEKALCVQEVSENIKNRAGTLNDYLSMRVAFTEGWITQEEWFAEGVNLSHKFIKTLTYLQAELSTPEVYVKASEASSAFITLLIDLTEDLGMAKRFEECEALCGILAGLDTDGFAQVQPLLVMSYLGQEKFTKAFQVTDSHRYEKSAPYGMHFFDSALALRKKHWQKAYFQARKAIVANPLIARFIAGSWPRNLEIRATPQMMDEAHAFSRINPRCFSSEFIDFIRWALESEPCFKDIIYQQTIDMLEYTFDDASTSARFKEQLEAKAWDYMCSNNSSDVLKAEIIGGKSVRPWESNQAQSSELTA